MQEIATKYKKTLAANRRLAILQHLLAAADYTDHDGGIRKMLEEKGDPVNREQLQTELYSLHHNHLLINRVKVSGTNLHINILSERGREVVSNEVSHPALLPD